MDVLGSADPYVTFDIAGLEQQRSKVLIQFTCFTSTNVQILTAAALKDNQEHAQP
jgi:hypothetical protein